MTRGETGSFDVSPDVPCILPECGQGLMLLAFSLQAFNRASTLARFDACDFNACDFNAWDINASDFNALGFDNATPARKPAFYFPSSARRFMPRGLLNLPALDRYRT